MPTLKIALPDGSTASHDLTDDTITIGRVEDNMIQIEDASVSSHHAELVRDGEDYILRDLDSTNGTRLNGAAHTEGKLKHGDDLVLGHINALYESENHADASQPMPEEAGVALQPAAQSVRPSNFSNASPFQKKSKKKEPAAVAILAFGVVAILAFAAAVAAVMSLQAPKLPGL